jgi:hypothetical protein
MYTIQSVMEMNGSLPVRFTPAWSDIAGLGRGQDIRVKRLTFQRGTTANFALNSQVTISSNVQRVVALTLEISDQRGESATLTDVPFDVSGDLAHQVIFNSERQNTPWSFVLKINSDDREMMLSFTLNYSNLSVVDSLAGITFYEALARGGEFRIRGRHPITGGELHLARGNVPAGTYEPADARLVKVLQNLAFIETKTGVSFTIPDHNIRYQDANTIAATAEILRTGHAQYKAQPWVSISAVEKVKIALESFANENPIPMALHYEGEIVRILGTHVPLGPVTLFCARSYITKKDLESLLTELEVAPPGTYLSVRFTPFEECPIEARYINWLPTDEAAAIKQLPIYANMEQLVENDAWTLPRMNAEEAVALLKSWYDEDRNDQKESWERLKVALDEDRLSDRKLFQ